MSRPQQQQTKGSVQRYFSACGAVVEHGQSQHHELLSRLLLLSGERLTEPILQGPLRRPAAICGGADMSRQSLQGVRGIDTDSKPGGDIFGSEDHAEDNGYALDESTLADKIGEGANLSHKPTPDLTIYSWRCYRALNDGILAEVACVLSIFLDGTAFLSATIIVLDSSLRVSRPKGVE